MHHRGGRSIVAQLLFAEGPETQRVHDREGPGAHGKDVTQDAADAGCGTLKRLDKRRVIVGLDFERAGPAIAHVDNAGIFSRSLYHALAARRQPHRWTREDL